MTQTEDKQTEVAEGAPFLDYLMDLFKNDKRGPIAELKRGAGDFPNYDERTLRHVAIFFGSDDATWRTSTRENSMLLVATLFALNPTKSDGYADMGEVMRLSAPTPEKHAAVEKRFLTLLGARRDEELATHLRHCISLAAARGVSIGWNQLFRDVQKLLSDDEDKRQQVVRKWSRSFWQKAPRDTADEATTS